MNLVDSKGKVVPLLALGGIFLFSFLLSIDAVSKIPLCFIHYFFHLDCPGCGLTRSFIAISHGHFLEAIRFNALGPVVYLFLALSLLRSLYRFLGRSEPSFLTLHSPWIYYLFAVLFWGQWVLKLTHQVPSAFAKLLS